MKKSKKLTFKQLKNLWIKAKKAMKEKENL